MLLGNADATAAADDDERTSERTRAPFYYETSYLPAGVAAVFTDAFTAPNKLDHKLGRTQLYADVFTMFDMCWNKALTAS